MNVFFFRENNVVCVSGRNMSNLISVSLIEWHMLKMSTRRLWMPEASSSPAQIAYFEGKMKNECSGPENER